MEPQGLNRYAYVFNNPIKYTDPTGHVPNDVRLDNFNDWLQAMGPDAVASYNHYYWGWYNWHFTKIYPNQAYWQQQHTNYLNSWVSGMGPDGVLQPKPPKQKTGIAAWNLTKPSASRVSNFITGVIKGAMVAIAIVTFAPAIAGFVANLAASVGFSSAASTIISGSTAALLTAGFRGIETAEFEFHKLEALNMGMTTDEAKLYASNHASVSQVMRPIDRNATFLSYIPTSFIGL